mmetsp:Transcript_43572/g.72594  ORF Transcript_43572/g.72594 Transcript_43572/m.72594 type:complete len:180 (+) Transcript_43572:129-668(+)
MAASKAPFGMRIRSRSVNQALIDVLDAAGTGQPHERHNGQFSKSLRRSSSAQSVVWPRPATASATEPSSASTSVPADVLEQFSHLKLRSVPKPKLEPEEEFASFRSGLNPEMSALEPEDFNELFDRKELQEVHLAKMDEEQLAKYVDCKVLGEDLDAHLSNHSYLRHRYEQAVAHLYNF